MDTLKFARTYVDKGFSVIPLKPKDKRPAISSWKEYQKRKPTNDEIMEWFGNGSNNNIGIVTGAISGIAVVDLDSKEAIRFSLQHKFPPTPLVNTEKGLHLYYTHKSGVRNFQKRDDLPDIDLRAEGGYIVAPPSVHPSGKQYTWGNGLGLDDRPFAELPEIILSSRSYDKVSVSDLENGVSKGMRNDSLARLIGSWLNDGFSLHESNQMAVQWNKQNTPPLDTDEVLKTVESIHKRHKKSLIMEKEPWPETVPFDDYTSLPEFPVDVFPSPYKEMVTNVAEVNQVDMGMPGTICLAVLSTCVAAKAYVSLGTHTENINLYLCCIADSGERKSSTVNVMTKPIKKFEKEFQEAVSEPITQAKHEVEILQARINTLKKSASSESDEDKRKRYMKEISDIEEQISQKHIPNFPVIVVDDITTEKLAIIMSQNNERCSIISSEGGIFDIMAGMYSDKGYNIDLYLKAHAGDCLSVHRVNRESLSMDHPSLTMGLAVQPIIINNIGRKVDFEGRGLLARFLYTLCESMIGHRKRQAKRLSDTIISQYSESVETLLHLDGYMTELKLDSEAQDIWDSFYNDVESSMKPNGELSEIKSWGSKLSGAVARIAGLLHFAEHSVKAIDIPISVKTIENACKIGRYFIEHAKTVFGIMSEDPAIESAKKILEYIRYKQPIQFTGREVMRNKNALKKMEQVRPGLDVLCDRGFIRPIEPNKTNNRRSTSTSYEVNPKLKL